MGNLVAVGNDLRVGNQLLYSKSMNKNRRNRLQLCPHLRLEVLVVSNAEKAYKPR